MRILRSFSCVIVLLLVGFVEVCACDCQFGGGAVCQDYWKASAVFVGTVIDSKTVSIKRDNYEEQGRLVRFSLDEAFRGVQGAQVEVMTGMGGGDCGIGFVQSQPYLVYANSFEGKLHTGICMRTKKISAAGSDLEYMRGLDTAKPGGAVYGDVVIHRRNEKGERARQPVSGAKIIIDGPEKTETTTDAKGSYRVDGLSAGDYTVTISPPREMATRVTEQKISLANGGCAVLSFWLENDGRLSGRIFDPAGLAVNKAEVFLTEFDKERYRGFSASAYSDELGKYAFKLIPPGRYVLLIRFDGMTSQNRPFPVLYYPGVSERTQARAITIGEGQKIADYDLQMPPLPLQHEVTGNVVWSTGKPALGARVEYTPVSGPISYGANIEGANFSFKAYEGLTLSMRALIESQNEKGIYSDWIRVTVIPGLPPIKLVLPQP